MSEKIKNLILPVGFALVYIILGFIFKSSAWNAILSGLFVGYCFFADKKDALIVAAIAFLVEILAYYTFALNLEYILKTLLPSAVYYAGLALISNFAGETVKPKGLIPSLVAAALVAIVGPMIVHIVVALIHCIFGLITFKYFIDYIGYIFIQNNFLFIILEAIFAAGTYFCVDLFNENVIKNL